MTAVLTPSSLPSVLPRRVFFGSHSRVRTLEDIPLKTSLVSAAQRIAMRNQAQSGTPVPTLCRQHTISSVRCSEWRSKYGGMDASLMSLARELHDENRRWKTLSAQAQRRAD